MTETLAGIWLSAFILHNVYGDGELITRRFKTIEACERVAARIKTEYPGSTAECSNGLKLKAAQP